MTYHRRSLFHDGNLYLVLSKLILVIIESMKQRDQTTISPAMKHSLSRMAYVNAWRNKQQQPTRRVVHRCHKPPWWPAALVRLRWLVASFSKVFNALMRWHQRWIIPVEINVPACPHSSTLLDNGKSLLVRLEERFIRSDFLVSSSSSRRYIKGRSNCPRFPTARRIAASTRSRFNNYWSCENLATGMKVTFEGLWRVHVEPGGIVWIFPDHTSPINYKARTMFLGSFERIDSWVPSHLSL